MKFCVDCVHYFYEPYENKHFCKVQIDLVTGVNITEFASVMRSKDSLICGIEGKLFVSKRISKKGL